MYLRVRAASPSAGHNLHFVIDGVKYPSVAIPKTGGGQIWTTVDMGAYRFAFNSYHTVSLVWDTSGVSVNWWQVQTVKIADGEYHIVLQGGGDERASQYCIIHALGKGRYALHALNDGALRAVSPQWLVTMLPDGLCSLRPFPAIPGGYVGTQEWSFIPHEDVPWPFGMKKPKGLW